MANIGTTTAFYKVESSLTRANNEVSKSMERLATGKQNANAGDRSSYVAMSDTFRLDFVGTKAGIKGASVAMGYLETGMRVLDAASGLLSRLQELAVLGANNTNTTQDHEAINAEAEALADEFNRLMTTSAYKGKNVFVSNAGSEYVSLGGRNAEMTFGIGTIAYTELYGSTGRLIAGGPSDTKTVNLTHLPSDAVAAKKYGAAVNQLTATSGATTLVAGKTYVVRNVVTAGGAAVQTEIDMNVANDASAKAIGDRIGTSGTTVKSIAAASKAATDDLAELDHITVGTADITVAQINAGAGNQVSATFAEVTTDNAFVAGLEYELVSLNGYSGAVATGDGLAIATAATQLDGTAISADLTVGTKFKIKSAATTEQLAGINSLILSLIHI